MNAVLLESVYKIFRHRPAMFNLLGSEKKGLTHAITDLSLIVSPGESVALIGPNGSGKSTLLKLCSGLLLPDAGRATIFDESTDDLQAVRRTTTFVGTGDRSFLGQLTAAENLDFFGVFDDIDSNELAREVPRCLVTVGLQQFADVRASKLSSGNLQRLALARGLLSRPRLLLLDEPSRSLDPDAVEHFWQILDLVRREGVTVIIATHNMEEAYRAADRVLGLNAGRITLDCRTRDLVDSSDLRQQFFASQGPTT